MRNKIIQYLLIFISLIALYLFVSDMNKSEAFAASQTSRYPQRLYRSACR